MHAHPVPLFNLDETGKYRLSHDGLQWILERGNPALTRPGKDSGFRGFTFVSSTKDILMREIERKKVPVCLAAEKRLGALPTKYRDCRAMIEASGVGGLLKYLDRPITTVRTDTGRLKIADNADVEPVE